MDCYRVALVAVAPLALGFAWVGCGDEATSTTTPVAGSGADAALPTPGDCTGADCSVCLAPGSDDHAALVTALAQAQPGQVVCLDEGSYALDAALTLPDGVGLRGAGKARTRLDFRRQSEEPFAVGAGEGSTLEGFAVLDAGGTGVDFRGKRAVVVRDVSVSWEGAASRNPASGILASSASGSIEGCEVCCASRAGIAVQTAAGAVRVRDNEVSDSTIGVAVESSQGVELRGNHVHHNAVGLVIASLPAYAPAAAARVKVHANVVEDNDRESLVDPRDVLSAMPTGVGVLVLAADDSEIHDNELRGHDTAGVLVTSYLEIVYGAHRATDFDPFPERNWIHDNLFTDNGQSPRYPSMNVYPDLSPGPDVGWDGCLPAGLDVAGTDHANCVSDNGEARYLDMRLLVCGADGAPSAELGTADCQRAALPEQ